MYGWSRSAQSAYAGGTDRALASFGIKTASRLRAALRFLQGNRPGLTNVYLGEQLLTQMKVAPDLVGRPQVSVVTALPEQFRNMGLGKKVYGEVMRRQPLDPVTGRLALLSDLKGSVSPEAQRVWQGMAKRPGYRLLDYTQSRGYTPQFEASLPPPARLTDPLPLDRRLLGRPRVGGGY